jgi:hypothetical protein
MSNTGLFTPFPSRRPLRQVLSSKVNISSRIGLRQARKSDPPWESVPAQTPTFQAAGSLSGRSWMPWVAAAKYFTFFFSEIVL